MHRSHHDQRLISLPLSLLLALIGASALAPSVWASTAVSPSTQLPNAGGRLQSVTTLSGHVRLQATQAPVANARVTLFTTNLAFFSETRSSADGSYGLSFLPAGTYRLGVEKPGLEYAESAQTIVAGSNTRDVNLASETEIGRWDIIGNTLPENFDSTDIGVLRPDGTVMFCHDTMDPILFNPVTGVKTFPAGSGTPQGCMNSTVLEDGGVLIVGGQSPEAPQYFGNAIPWVKRFTPQQTFVQQSDMLLSLGRWYPGLARLADGRLLIMGGGTAPSAVRTNTCEIYTPATQSWAYTANMNSALEFPPCGLLYDGRVLRSWGSAPELYSPGAGTWSATGNFVFPNRGFPDHSDHSLILLTGGRALAMGVRRLNQPNAVMTEFYDPNTGQWSVGTSPSLSRMQCEVVYLPDGHVFVGAGDQETTGGTEPNVLGVVRRCDLFDPNTQGWLRVPNMNWYREYHAVTLLVPDGRVITTGGTLIKFQVGPTSADIEAYSPPYLFRGVRPQLSNLSNTRPVRGETISLNVAPATQLTGFVLMGTQSTTHWVDGGIPRRLELPVVQSGGFAQVTLPTSPNLLPVGWYTLYGMVDDIPSVGIIIHVRP